MPLQIKKVKVIHISTANISRTVKDRVSITPSNMGYLLAYLELTLVRSDGQGQGRSDGQGQGRSDGQGQGQAHFDGAYL